MRRVFVSGCFDALHPGHIEFLKFARAQGDYLSVSVASDEAIWKLKRREPVFPQDERCKMVVALRCVDRVHANHEIGANDCFYLLKHEPPDVWVFNRDDANYDAKVKLATELNIHIVLNNRPPNYYSTSGLIQRLKREPWPPKQMFGYPVEVVPELEWAK